MAKGNTGYVNVGQVLNPVESLSRSLTGLSQMYANKSDKEIKQKALDASNAESKRRWDSQQKDKDNALLEKKRKEDSIAAGNQLFIDINEGRNPNLKRSDYSKTFQDQFRKQEDLWNKEEKINRDYLLNGGTDEQLNNAVNTLIGERGEDSQRLEASRAKRRERLSYVRKSIEDATTDEEKKAIADKAILDIFGGRRDRLNSVIADGSFLTNKQRANALIRYVPEDFKKYGNVIALQNAIESSMSGNTKKEILDKENKRVNAINTANEQNYKSKVAAYKAELAERKKGKDWKTLSKTLKEDIGYLDNGDKEDIVDLMLAEGIPHDRIENAVQRLISTSPLGTKSIPYADSNEVTDAISTIASELRRDNPNFGKPLEAPKRSYKVLTPKGLEDVQLDMYKRSFGSVKSAIEYKPEWDKYKEKVSTSILNPENVDSNTTPISAENTGVPEPSNPVVTGPDGVLNVKESPKIPRYVARDYEGDGALTNVGRFLDNAVTGAKNVPVDILNGASYLNDVSRAKRLRSLDSDKKIENYLENLPLIPEEVKNRPSIFTSNGRQALANKPIDIYSYTPTMEMASKENSYSDMIAQAESSGRGKVVNGQYLGKYQMGNMALQDAGYKDSKGNWTGKNGIDSKEDYLNSSKAQDDAFNTLTNQNTKALNAYGAMDYVGKTFRGVKVTAKGIMAAAHLVGAKAVSDMFKTGVVPEDANGTKALAYLKMGSGS